MKMCLLKIDRNAPQLVGIAVMGNIQYYMKWEHLNYCQDITLYATHIFFLLQSNYTCAS